MRDAQLRHDNVKPGIFVNILIERDVQWHDLYRITNDPAVGPAVLLV